MPSRVIPSFSERAKLYLESDELNETINIPAMRIDHEGMSLLLQFILHVNGARALLNDLRGGR